MNSIEKQPETLETEKVRIGIAGDGDRDVWDAFVTGHPDGTHFHLYGWAEVIQSVYGYEPAYLIARAGAKTVGVLPLIDVTSPLLGRSLISTAFTVGGGPLAVSPMIAAQLAGRAAKLGESRGVKYVELRSQKASLEHWAVKSDKYAAFSKPLISDTDLMLKKVPRRRRAVIRKALAAEEAGDLSIVVDDDLDTFYSLYARLMRDLGTPVFPKRYVETLFRVFGDNVEISTASFQGAPIASVLSFYFRDRVSPYFFGFGPGAREARATDYLPWTLMCRAAENGVKEFDFGRSKVDSGNYLYKKLWGFDPVPLEYQYWLVNAPSIPDVNPNNPKFNIFTKVWKRLPVPVANVMGPLVAPNFA